MQRGVDVIYAFGLSISAVVHAHTLTDRRRACVFLMGQYVVC